MPAEESNNRHEGRGGKSRTWKIPRLALVEVDIDHVDASVRAAFAGELAAEVVHDELVVPGVEPEPRRQPRLHHADRAHGLALSSLDLKDAPPLDA
jgi:hypothetical protein